MLEEKVFVISSIRWEYLEKLILQDPEFKKIKQDGICAYYWFDNDKTYEQNARRVHQLIDADPLGSITFFQLSPVINGKRDLFSSRRSREKKMKMPYFQQSRTEISERELQTFTRSHNIPVKRFGKGIVLNVKGI